LNSIPLYALAAALAAPAPAPAPQMHYDQAPEPWRGFLLKAREADAIADPLQRCLAFPDAPGNQWPANAAKQHCDLNFGPVPTLAEVRALLDAKDLPGLEARFQKLQDLHESDTQFSERIHTAFDRFDSSYESGVLSKRWLELAPDSPYAMVARASYFRRLGWDARGTKWMQETPREQVEQMDAHLSRAVELYRQALKLKPNLMPAHAGLIDIGANGGMDEKALFAAAQAADPGCALVAIERMQALEPRWGGSYVEMLALDQQLVPRLSTRPLLSLARAFPYDDLHNVLYAAEKYDEAAKALAPALPLSTHPEIWEDMATVLRHEKTPDRWQILADYVAGTRYRPGTAFDARERGKLQLLAANDAESAAKSLAHSAKEEPGNAYTHYLYGAALGRLARYDEAEREYLLAMQDKPDTGNHRDGLLELTELMFRAHDIDKAQKYARQAVAEYPDLARARYAYAITLGLTRTPSTELRKAWEDFLAKADPTDPKNARPRAQAQQNLEALKASVLKAGGTW
jgi:tetratricopeptide (TPR) repeat protein